jgi:hypothetical protein
VLRVVAPAATSPRDDELATWLGSLTGRLHHLAFTTQDTVAPAGSAPADRVPGLLEPELPALVVEPERNMGTRLVVGRAIAADPPK